MALKLGLSVALIMVCPVDIPPILFKAFQTLTTPSQDHFHKVTGTMASIREPQYALTEDYIRTTYYASMRVEPATRGAIILAAAAGIREHQQTPFPLGALGRIRGYALSCLRSALEDPNRCTSDAVITAVLNMTIHEHLHGRPSDSEVHMLLRGATMNERMVTMMACLTDVTHAELSDWVSFAYR